MPTDSPKRPARPTKKDLEAQLARLTAALQRERADADNVRRQAQAARDHDRQLARRDTLASLLPVIDNLQRAFARPPAELVDNQWAKGVLGIERQLETTLADLGLTRIEVVGRPFDPDLMEAVEAVTTTDQPEQTVVDEAVRGYRWGNEVLRVAQVRVAVRPRPAGPEPTDPSPPSGR